MSYDQIFRNNDNVLKTIGRNDRVYKADYTGNLCIVAINSCELKKRSSNCCINYHFVDRFDFQFVR